MTQMTYVAMCFITVQAAFEASCSVGRVLQPVMVTQPCRSSTR